LNIGTGYSSLNYLKRLPVSCLKIDQSFIREMTVDSGSAGIVTAIIAMAHTLGLKVVAEGVEHEAQLTALRARGCDQSQGFLFSRALPPTEFAALFPEQAPWASTAVPPRAAINAASRTMLS
jgi:sensor c-di-GMP phosphodiesterase-like protein